MPTSIDDVVATFQRWLYLPRPDALLAVLGTVAANRLHGDPVWLMVVGPPGGGKSEILQALLGLPNTHPAATITERALLSGTAKKDREQGAKGGLLREIGRFGIVVCKDFGSLLSMHREERARTLAALREIYDGSWTRHVGVDGGRALHWQGKIGLVAGVTPTIDRHHGVMGAMGERFLLMRLTPPEAAAQARRALEHAGHEEQMRHELAAVVGELFRNKGYRATWSPAERERLVALATLVARCRSSVERDSSSREIELVPASEAPTRLVVALERLLTGLKLLGVEHEAAWFLISQIAYDSMPRLRWDVLQVLFGADGEDLETPAIAEVVRHPTTTTRRALEDLTAHYTVERHRHGKGNADTWTLTEWAQKQLNDAIAGVPEPADPETVPEMSHPRNDASSTHSLPKTHVGRQSGNGPIDADLEGFDW
jgi:hypothetical protein